jgi:hypothetical protein
MTNYYVLPLEVDSDFIWCVMETKTEQLIQAFEFEDEAEQYAEFLEDGGAFAGFTPSFILREVALSSDLNRDFQEYVIA